MSDADRALLSEGKKKLRAVLRVAQAAGMDPTIILSSPYRRALETAQVAAKELAYRGELIRSDALRPGCGPAEVWEEIRAFKSSERILLSGHEPLLGYLTAFLLGVPALLIDFKKGAIVHLELEQMGLQPRGVLRWYLTPKLALGAKS